MTGAGLLAWTILAWPLASLALYTCRAAWRGITHRRTP